MNEFSKRLQIAMDNAGITQAGLSRVTGINQGTLNHYLRGRYLAKQDRVYTLAEALNVSPSWLMGLDDTVEAPDPDDGILVIYRSLSEAKKAEALRYMKYLALFEDNK